jgi:hypothetical protein
VDERGRTTGAHAGLRNASETESAHERARARAVKRKRGEKKGGAVVTKKPTTPEDTRVFTRGLATTAQYNTQPTSLHSSCR